MKDNNLTTLDDVTKKRASQTRPMAQILNQIPAEIIEKPVSETLVKDNSTQQMILQMVGLGVIGLLVMVGINYYKDSSETNQQAGNNQKIVIENLAAYPIYGIKSYHLGTMALKPIKYLTVEGDNLIPIGFGENYNEIMARWQATIQSMDDISITATDKVALVSVKLKDNELKLELKRSGDVYTASKGDLRFIVKFLSDKRFQYVMANKNTNDGYMIDSKNFNPSTGTE